jgi:DNA polymerase (family X)
MNVYNSEIAEKFELVADILELKDANQFRVRAYREAANTIRNHSRQMQDLIQEGKDLTNLAGIGKDLAEKIAEIIETGKLKQLNDLKNKTPAGLAELLNIEGLGPKRVKRFYQELNIETVKDLEKAIKNDEIKKLDGFGDKSQQNIKEALERYKNRQANQRVNISKAEQIINPLINYLKNIKEAEKVKVAGSYRRKQETIGDFDILVTSKNKKKIMQHFVEYDEIKKIIAQGETKSTIKLRTGIQVDLRVVPPESYGAALLYFTGSKQHNIELRNLALNKNRKLNEYGVFNQKGKKIAGKTEEEIYQLFNAQFIPPELREARGELEAARQNKLPNLITVDDLKGDLQMHTTDSDGRYSIEEMIQAAVDLDHKYIAITDHSAYMGITQGLDEKNLQKQIEKIKKLDKKYNKIRVLAGIEADVKEDGSLDLKNNILKKLDIVLGSLHTKTNLPRKKQTKRIITAFKNPYLNILSHPTGRIINKRKPMSFDFEKVIKAAEKNKIALEINAHPSRLDINDVQAKMAKEAGLKIAISTDAHWAEELKNLKYGIYQARRGWIEPEDVINSWELNDLLKFLKK